MISEKIFKTKTGFCHILPDKIVLTRDGIIGNVSEIITNNNISRLLFIYGIISIGLLYIAFRSFQNGDIIRLIVFVLISIYLIWGIFNSLNNSATPIIYRDKIKVVKFKKGIKGFTRPRFDIFFEDERGKIKRRIIMLNGSLHENQEGDIQNALNIMIDEKLINDSY